MKVSCVLHCFENLQLLFGLCSIMTFTLKELLTQIFDLDQWQPVFKAREISPKSVYPPQGFCEIWENKKWNSGRQRRFSGWFGGFWGVWTLFGNQPPHPPTFGRNIPKKRFFTPSLQQVLNLVFQCLFASFNAIHCLVELARSMYK